MIFKLYMRHIICDCEGCLSLAVVCHVTVRDVFHWLLCVMTSCDCSLLEHWYSVILQLVLKHTNIINSNHSNSFYSNFGETNKS